MDLNLQLDITAPAVHSVTGGSRSGLDCACRGGGSATRSLFLQNATSAHRILRPTHDSSTDAYACDGHVYDAFAPH